MAEKWRGHKGIGARTRVAPVARMTTLTGDPAAVNTETQTPIVAEKSLLKGVSSRFTHTFAANSVTFLRLRPIRR